MNDPKPHDDTTDRLRRGLEELTAGISDDPPELGSPTARPVAPDPGRGRWRWLAGAAAAVLVAGGLAGTIAIVGDGSEDQSETPAITDDATPSPTTSTPSTDTARPGPATPSTDPSPTLPGGVVTVPDYVPNGLVSEATKPRPDASFEEALIEGIVVHQETCVLIRDGSGEVILPIWPHGTVFDALHNQVVLADGRTIPLGANVSAAGGVTDLSRADITPPLRESCQLINPRYPDTPKVDTVWGSMHDIDIIDVPDFSTETVERVATVAETSEHGPQLCDGPIRTSRPPQCGGPDIVNWSWFPVDHQDNGRGSRWGDYVITGKLSVDGTSFTVGTPWAREATPADSPTTGPTTLPTVPPSATTTAQPDAHTSTSAQSLAKEPQAP